MRVRFLRLLTQQTRFDSTSSVSPRRDRDYCQQSHKCHYQGLTPAATPTDTQSESDGHRRERQTDRQAETKTATGCGCLQTDTYKHTQPETQTDRQTESCHSIHWPSDLDEPPLILLLLLYKNDRSRAAERCSHHNYAWFISAAANRNVGFITVAGKRDRIPLIAIA